VVWRLGTVCEDGQFGQRAKSMAVRCEYFGGVFDGTWFSSAVH
jgi:hypothetical protein